jgi:hypothetical protein
VDIGSVCFNFFLFVLQFINFKYISMFSIFGTINLTSDFTFFFFFMFFFSFLFSFFFFFFFFFNCGFVGFYVLRKCLV